MFENIGKKIKVLAKVIFFIEAISAIIAGFVLCMEEDEMLIIISFVGPIVAWISSWLLYGFGELIDKVCDIEKSTRNITATPENPTRSETVRRDQLESLRLKGMISEEEYQNALARTE